MQKKTKRLLHFSMLFFLLTAFRATYSQEKNSVYLVEDKQKKRTIIYVQNDTNEDKSVFLKVNPIGYRKSAQRPTIKKIPANSKLQMMILIPLKDVTSSYTYNLIINDKLETIDIDRNKNQKNEAPVSSILKSELIVFTKKQCTKCQILISKLKHEHVKFREVNIDSKNRYRDYLWELLDKEGYDKNTVRIPLIVKNGALIHPIDDPKKFVNSITSNLKNAP